MPRKLQRKYKIIWGGLVALAAVAFAAVEGVALYTPEGGDTLSEQVWALQEAYPKITYALGGAAASWLLIHFSPWGRKRKRLGPRPDATMTGHKRSQGSDDA